MQYFFTVEAELPPDVGFPLFGRIHLAWLCTDLALTVLLCLLYRRLPAEQRGRARRSFGCCVLLLELLRAANLLLQGTYSVYYLPLHLCGIAVFLTLRHALQPGPLLGNLLYSTCMPGALFALLFPDWTAFPPFSYHSLVSFLIHMLLTAYPLMLLFAGELRPDVRYLPRCFLALVGMAVPVYLFDRVFHANYMFLLQPAPGSPLEWFAALLGVPGYLLGYLPMLVLVWTLLYLPFRRKMPPHPAP